MRHGDLALVQVRLTQVGMLAPPQVARYTDYDEYRRDAGGNPDDLMNPYWSFFGVEWTARLNQVERVEPLRVLHVDGREVWECGS